VQGRSESRWRIIAHRCGGRKAWLARGGIREHDAFLGHEMRGPAGTGLGDVSMAGGREGRKAAQSNNYWWWCIIAIFQVVGRNRYFHRQFCVITVPCV